MSTNGWIKLHRQLLESRWGSNLEMIGFWSALLMMANHKPAYTFDGTLINPGQFMTSRDALAARFRMNPSKIYRMLSALSDAKQIEQQTSNKNTIITILNWDSYQTDEQQMNNKRTTGEQQANTNKNENNNKNINTLSGFDENNPAHMVLKMLNEICGKRYKPTKTSLTHINARLRDKFVLNDFETVIRSKHQEWSENADMAQYLRPETLFGTKFQTYLQNAGTAPKSFHNKLSDFFESQNVKPQSI